MKNYELAILVKNLQDIIKLQEERIYNLEEEIKKIKKETASLQPY
jgi:hypothetical protein